MSIFLPPSTPPHSIPKVFVARVRRILRSNRRRPRRDMGFPESESDDDASDVDDGLDDFREIGPLPASLVHEQD